MTVSTADSIPEPVIVLGQDLTGRKFGRWTCVRFHGRAGNGKQKRTKWLCECECGNTKPVEGYVLRSGRSTSCGCYKKEQAGKANLLTPEEVEERNRQALSIPGKTCYVCKNFIPANQALTKRKPNGRVAIMTICKPCKAGLDKARYKQNMAAARKQSLKNHYLARYGLTPEMVEQMKIAQAGRCKICDRQPQSKGLHIDHCHSTGKVRGLLCGTCNQGIGLLKEDPELIRKAANYVAFHQSSQGKVAELTLF